MSHQFRGNSAFQARGHRGRGYSRQHRGGGARPRGGPPQGYPFVDQSGQENALQDFIRQSMQQMFGSIAPPTFGAASTSGQAAASGYATLASEPAAVVQNLHEGKRKRPRPGRFERSKRFRMDSTRSMSTGCSFLHLTTHESHPVFEGLCRRCGEVKHLSKACPNFINSEGVALSCDYCLGGHRILVCPVLHGRCDLCWCRGHIPKQCHHGAPVKLRALYQKFMESAPRGLLTRYYRRNIGYGFFALPSWVCFELLTSVSHRFYPQGDRTPAGQETCVAEVFNAVLTLLRGKLVAARVRDESECSVAPTGGFIQGLQEFYNRVKRFNVSVHPDRAVVSIMTPPILFPELLRVEPQPEQQQQLPAYFTSPAPVLVRLEQKANDPTRCLVPEPPSHPPQRPPEPMDVGEGVPNQAPAAYGDDGLLDYDEAQEQERFTEAEASRILGEGETHNCG